MKKKCVKCDKEFELQSDVIFCPEDGGFIIPENLKKELIKNLSIGEWLINFLVAAIPLVGLVFLIIWGNDEKNGLRKNWAMANLIWTGIITVFFLLIYVIFIASIINKSSNPY
jgi:hypothetical protein